MLQYMSGIEIGRSRGKSKSSSKPGKVNKASRKKALKNFKGGLKKLSKMSPKEQIQYAKSLKKKYSPLNKMRMQKAIREQRKKELQIEQGEPFSVEMPPTPQGEEFVDQEGEQDEQNGVDEINEAEFPNEEGSPESESEGEGMGDNMLHYPGFSGSLSKEKKRAKIDRKKSKSELTRAKGTSKIEKAKAKSIKAEKGGSGKGKELLDTAKSLLSKGGDEEKAPEQSFFEKNKMLILGGGAVAVLGIVMLMKKK